MNMEVQQGQFQTLPYIHLQSRLFIQTPYLENARDEILKPVWSKFCGQKEGRDLILQTAHSFMMRIFTLSQSLKLITCSVFRLGDLFCTAMSQLVLKSDVFQCCRDSASNAILAIAVGSGLSGNYF